MELSVFWFRRDLRLDDNHGLMKALQSGMPVLPLFIFDQNILRELPQNDARVSFIFNQLVKIDKKLRAAGSSLLIKFGEPFTVWQQLVNSFSINAVYANHDYEPYSFGRDIQVTRLLKENGITFHSFKDQVIFEMDEITKADGQPYTIYTPYKNKWLENFSVSTDILPFDTTSLFENFIKCNFEPAKIEEIGFVESAIAVPDFNPENIDEYEKFRDIPWMNRTSMAGPHLRFGTVSIRQLVKMAFEKNLVFLGELIWREFFMMILFHYPQVVSQSFKSQYDQIRWLNNEDQFEKWKSGNTGYPMVDAGMRQLNKTGFMHNRVRMVTASFLCKHLLIDWRWGEAYLAQKLLDYELSSNNGNWQWAAGTGCDAAPYFRVFNPTIQLKKFDPELNYIKQWIPEFFEINYPAPMIDHKFARQRAIITYKNGLDS